ncbi:MAG TPA: hypothetical protein VMG36_02850 [Thermoplasmata archaeon]|nr:hypothetical protein [Thermoplasmata archaeon]
MTDGEKGSLRRRLLAWRATRYPGPTHSEIGLPEEPTARPEVAVTAPPAPPPVHRPRGSEEPPWPAVAPRAPTPPLLDVNALLARRWGLPETAASRAGGYRPASAPPTAAERSSPRLLDHLILPGPRTAPAGPEPPVLPPSPRL